MLPKLLAAAIAIVQIVAPAMASDVSLDALLEAGHWKRLQRMAESQAADKQNPQAAYFLSCAKMAFGDLDGDGLGDLFVTHLTEEFHALWKQGPRGLFSDQVATVGLQRQAWRGTGFGAVMNDFNGDGAMDLAWVNGLVRRLTPGQAPVLAGVDPWWARYAQRPQLFMNRGDGQFLDRSPAEPVLGGAALVGRSLALVDLDADGGMDLVVAGVGGPVRLLRNVAPGRGHWLCLRLVDPARGRRDAIGAEVTLVTAGGRRLGASRR